MELSHILGQGLHLASTFIQPFRFQLLSRNVHSHTQAGGTARSRCSDAYDPTLKTIARHLWCMACPHPPWAISAPPSSSLIQLPQSPLGNAAASLSKAEKQGEMEGFLQLYLWMLGKMQAVILLRCCCSSAGANPIIWSAHMLLCVVMWLASASQKNCGICSVGRDISMCLWIKSLNWVGMLFKQ